MVVGHIPRSISTVCYIFLGKPRSTITCKVTGDKRYSRDLPQGGLVIPCQLEFKGEESAVNKVQKMLSADSQLANINAVTAPVQSSVKLEAEPKAKKLSLQES
jgi:hypothetical protein